MRQLSRTILPSWMFHAEFWRLRSTEKEGPPHLWLQRSKSRETVLIHHRCHHLKIEAGGGEGSVSTGPSSSCGFPRVPSFLPLWMRSHRCLAPGGNSG